MIVCDNRVQIYDYRDEDRSCGKNNSIRQYNSSHKIIQIIVKFLNLATEVSIAGEKYLINKKSYAQFRIRQEFLEVLDDTNDCFAECMDCIGHASDIIINDKNLNIFFDKKDQYTKTKLNEKMNELKNLPSDNSLDTYFGFESDSEIEPS